MSWKCKHFHDNKDIKKEEIRAAIESLIDIGISIIVPTKDVMKTSVEIAFEFDITVYDAYFIALAKVLKFTFVTADEKLYNKTKTLKFVKFLKGF